MMSSIIAFAILSVVSFLYWQIDKYIKGKRNEKNKW